MASLAQFAIDVAAKMSGASQTSAELDKLSKGLMSGGKDAAYFESAIAKVSNSLSASKTAATAANAAFADGKGAYNDLEKAALRAEKAAERAGKKHKGVVPPELAAAALAARTAVEAEAVGLDKLRASAQAAAAKSDSLALKLTNLNKLQQHHNKTLGQNKERLAGVIGGLGALGGPVGAIGQKLLNPIKGFHELREKLGTTRAAALVFTAGIGSLVAGLAQLGVAGVVGGVALAGIAFALANNAREAKLANDAFAASDVAFNGWAQASEAAARASGLADDALRGLGKGLRDAKVGAEDMPKALAAAAKAEAALGAGGSSKFIEQLKAGKLSVEEFSETVESQFGGHVQKKMLGLGAQFGTLKRNVSGIFGKLNIEPVLEGFSKLIGLLDSSTASGRFLQKIATGILQPLFDAMGRGLVQIEAFWLGLQIGILQNKKAFQPLIDLFRRFVGGSDDNKTAKDLRNAANAGQSFADTLAGLAPSKATLDGIGTAFFVLGATIGFVWELAKGIVGTLWEIGKLGVEAIGFLIDQWKTLMGWIGEGVLAFDDFFARVTNLFNNFSLAEIGVMMIKGLALGISDGASFVIDAVKNVLGGAITGAKELLGIHSPSRVFARMGQQTAEGYEEGIEDESAGPQKALSRMVAPPEFDTPELTHTLSSLRGGAKAPSGAQAAGAPVLIDFSGMSFEISGLEGAQQAIPKIREELEAVIRQAVAQLRGAVAA